MPSPIAWARSPRNSSRGLIWTYLSSVLPQTCTQFGFPAGGIAFHERIARTRGRTGLPQNARVGSWGKVTTYVSGFVGFPAQSVELGMSCALNDARPASWKPE